MLTKTEIIKRIELELKDDDTTRNELLSLWKLYDDTTGLAIDILPPKKTNVDSSEKVGLSNFFCYNNYQAQSYNTCGQAVIASYIDHFGKNPYSLSKTYRGHDGNLHFNPNQILSKVFNDFGPNWPWKNGITVRETIMAAFNSYGINNHQWHPGTFSDGQDSKKELVNWISNYRLPVIVLVDAGKSWLSGSHFSLHWCVVYGFDDDNVYIATWEDTLSVSWADFMDAWHCWFLPWPNNYYQIRAWV
ncbi:MAG: hypothetical protein V4572_02695 [Bacteroidota bacterium]